MDNILAPNYHLKPALLSEVAIQLYNQKKKAETAYKDGWFKFLFISMCSNQVKSSTSSFHRINRQTLSTRHNKYFDKINDEMNSGFSIEEHEDLQENQSHQLTLIRTAMKNVEPHCQWVENEMGRLHYGEGLSFRKIESFYEGAIKYTRAFQLFKRWEIKFLEELKRLENETNEK